MEVGKSFLSSKIALLPTGIAQFIQKSIVWDPAKRITPDQALQMKCMEAERLNLNPPEKVPINHKQNIIKSPQIRRPWH